MSPGSMARVLVVDDDPRVGRDLREMLEPMAYQVQITQGQGLALLQNAKTVAREFRPHVAIVDLRLLDNYRDERSGLDLLQGLQPARCILYSGYLTPDVIRDALSRYHATGWVSKGENPQLLLDAIADAARETAAGPAGISIHRPYPWSSQAIVQTLFGRSTTVPAQVVDDILCQLFPGTRELALERVTGAVASSPISGTARSVVLKAYSDGLEPVLVKLAPAERICREIANYDQHVKDRLVGRFYAQLEYTAEFWELGAVRYAFLGSEIARLQSFSGWYLGNRAPPSILNPLTHFFKGVWVKHYTSLLSTESGPLFQLYDQPLRLRERLKQFGCPENRRSLAGLGSMLPNPVSWVLEHADDSLIPGARLAIVHGDLHGDNLFVDHEHAWVVDFERTGPGHVLRDFVELEVDILTRLVAGDLDPSLFHELTIVLAQGTEPEMSGNVSRRLLSNPETQKAFAVIAGLRRMAKGLYQDSREYLWALLFDALLVATVGQVSTQGERALLLAAVLCERLRRWGQRWPPEGWVGLTGNAAVAFHFFRKAGFDVVQVSDASLSARYPSKGGWAKYGDVPILCIDGDVTAGHLMAISRATQTKSPGADALAFVVHSGHLVADAARRLWELKEDHLLVVPIHISTLNELLSSSEQLCYARLTSLRDDWSTLSDPYAAIDSSDPQWFVGRKKAIQDALECIDQSKPVMVFGMRRIGKTLLLNQLHRACHLKDYPVTLFTCSPESSLPALFHNVIEGLGRCAEALYPQLRLPEWKSTIASGAPAAAAAFKSDFAKLEEAVVQTGAHPSKFVVLIDEIDHIVPTERSTKQDYRRYMEFFQTIKGLIESSRPLSVVVAGYSPKAINRTDRWPGRPQSENPMYDRFKETDLRLMSGEESSEVVQRLGALVGLQYTEQSLERIYREAQGHPEVTRKLCSCVLAEQADGRRWPRAVEPDVVELAVQRFLGDPRYAFYLDETYWKSSLMVDPDMKKLVLFALAKAPCSKEEIMSWAADQFSAFLPYEHMAQEIPRVLASLVELGMVSCENGQYRIAIRLLERWIRREKLKEDRSGNNGEMTTC